MLRTETLSTYLSEGGSDMNTYRINVRTGLCSVMSVSMYLPGYEGQEEMRICGNKSILKQTWLMGSLDIPTPLTTFTFSWQSIPTI